MGLRDMYIVRTKEYFEEHDKVYLVTEYLSGGELLQAVQNRSSYTEADARWCFQQILRGIRYLHSNGVTHGDIKSANILLVKVQNIMLIKIGEFNLAKRFEEPMTSDCGTLIFKAPEIVKGKLRTCDSPAVDLWSAGVILFFLLEGSPPFYDTDPVKLQAAICAGKFPFEDSAWENISENAKDLVSKLLVIDPKKRLSAVEALAHPWFSDPNVRTVQSLPSTQSNLSASLKLLCKQKSARSITFKELMLYSLLSLCASAIEHVERVKLLGASDACWELRAVLLVVYIQAMYLTAVDIKQWSQSWNYTCFDWSWTVHDWQRYMRHVCIVSQSLVCWKNLRDWSWRQLPL